MTNKCTLPPEGWYCTLDAGHDGPCPTWPKRSKEVNYTEMVRLLNFILDKNDGPIWLPDGWKWDAVKAISVYEQEKRLKNE